MSEDIFQRLRKAIGQRSETFDATPSGVEIKFLKKLFTAEEAQMYMHLTDNLETPEQIASRARQDPGTAAVTLKGMAEKGLLFPKREGEDYYYAAAPFAHGILEHQVHRLDRELAEYYEEYMFAEKIPDDPDKLVEYPLRTLPVKAPINVSRPIQPYENVKDRIMKQDRIAVARCFCAEHSAGWREAVTNPLRCA